jgi:hypothetical protein
VPQSTLTQLFGQQFPYVPVLRPGTVTGQHAQPAGRGLWRISQSGPARRAGHGHCFESDGNPAYLRLLDGVGREVRRAVDGRGCPPAPSACRWT